jgi:hypothetical protein
VTGKALEETASEIIRLMASRRLTPPQTLENLPPTEVRATAAASVVSSALAAAGGKSKPDPN